MRTSCLLSCWYYTIPRPLQRPRHGLRGRRETRHVDRVPEGIVKSRHRFADTLRQRDLRQRADAATNRDERVGRTDDQKIPHLAETRGERNIDERIGRRWIATR